MSLALRLNLVLFLTIAVLVASGTAVVIFSARKSVKNEIRSSVQLAVQLMELETAQPQRGPESIRNWLAKISGLGRFRHLKIRVQPLDKTTGLAPHEFDFTAVDGVPDWFVWAVIPEPISVIKSILIADSTTIQLVIQADPRDEIAEAWGEAGYLLGLVSVLAVMVYILVSITVERAFRPVKVILDGLEEIKRGRFSERIPEFGQPEFDRIADTINHTANALQQASLDNEALRRHSLSVREQERRYLAQELHDEFGQSLSAIKAVTASLSAAGLAKEHSLGIDSILRTCDHLFAVLSTMMRRLHPLILDELGLTAALEDMFAIWQKQHPQIRLDREINSTADRYASEKQIHVFRIVQECMTNIVKHASAERVDVRIGVSVPEPDERNCDRLRIRVRDDGVGFDPKAIKPGFGLRGIEERVIGLGGDLIVKSAPGDGVEIRIEVPFQEAASD